MRLAIVRRALVATAALTILSVPVISADSTALTTQLNVPGGATVFNAGTVPPSTDVLIDVYFILTCTGTDHVDTGQTIRMSLGTRSIPKDGGFHVGTLLFGLGGDWPADGKPCPTGLPPTVGGPLHMSVTSPSTPGPVTFRFSWNPGVTPPGNGDSSIFAGTTPPELQVTMTVTDGTPPANTPPTLNLPANKTVEGNELGGATVTWTATASDAEDATPPAVSCNPETGADFALGPTTVSCSATDMGGLTTTGTFQVTVVDTAGPTFAGVPGDISLTTSDPSGAVLTYTPPTATDVVDGVRPVSCSLASGATAPVGDTTVTCTATDKTNHSSSATFVVHVRLAQASWEEPGAGGLVVNGSRTVPIKVGLSLDGRPIVGGPASVSVVPCGGGSPVQTDDLDLQANGRWMGHLSTDGLANGCYQVVASANGFAIGSFQMDVRGAVAPAATPKTTKK